MQKSLGRANSTKHVVNNPVSELDESVTSITAGQQSSSGPSAAVSAFRRPFFAGLGVGLVVALIIGVVLGVKMDDAKSNNAAANSAGNGAASVSGSSDATNEAARSDFLKGFNNTQYGMWYKTGQTQPHVFDVAYPIPDLLPELTIPSEKYGVTLTRELQDWNASFTLIEEDQENGLTDVGFEFDPFYTCDTCNPKDKTCHLCDPGDTTTGAFKPCDKGDPGAEENGAGSNKYICMQPLPKGYQMFKNWQSKFQTIQRFHYGKTQAETTGRGVNNQPVYYVEVDYNSEGLNRGPGPAGGSFLQPHFDFHFYTKPWDDVRNQICTSLDKVPIWGRTCPLLNIPPIQTANYLAIPFQFLPQNWKPDLGSSIPLMGLHTFNVDGLQPEEAEPAAQVDVGGSPGGQSASATDGSVPYSVEKVFTHPPQLVGTYRGEIQFIEASPVVPGINAMVVEGRKDQKDVKKSWSFPPPVTKPAMASWPISFNMQYVYATDKLRVFMRFSTFEKLPGVQAVCGDETCRHCTNISGICLS